MSIPGRLSLSQLRAAMAKPRGSLAGAAAKSAAPAAPALPRWGAAAPALPRWGAAPAAPAQPRSGAVNAPLPRSTAWRDDESHITYNKAHNPHRIIINRPDCSRIVVNTDDAGSCFFAKHNGNTFIGVPTHSMEWDCTIFHDHAGEWKQWWPSGYSISCYPIVTLEEGLKLQDPAKNPYHQLYHAVHALVQPINQYCLCDRPVWIDAGTIYAVGKMVPYEPHTEPDRDEIPIRFCLDEKNDQRPKVQSEPSPVNKKRRLV